jgi:hypothetical protein
MRELEMYMSEDSIHMEDNTKMYFRGNGGVVWTGWLRIKISCRIL